MSDVTDNELDREYGLRDIARWLTTPAASGLYLSMRDLERIGRSVGITGLPRQRRFAIEQLFRSAALDESLDVLLDSLQAEAISHRDAYQSCGSPALHQWDELVVDTIERIGLMRQESTG